MLRNSKFHKLVRALYFQHTLSALMLCYLFLQHDLLVHINYLFNLAVPVPAANQLVCTCNEPLFADSRFPYCLCNACKTYWCTNDHCRVAFPRAKELMAHMKRCHLYPLQQLPMCSCNRQRKPQTNFDEVTEQCTGCNRWWCWVNGCDRDFAFQGQLLNHLTTKHKNPFVCAGCNNFIQPSKIRDGTIQSGVCTTCRSTFWCLRGHCTEERNSQLGIQNHALTCKFPAQ